MRVLDLDRLDVCRPESAANDGGEVDLKVVTGACVPDVAEFQKEARPGSEGPLELRSKRVKEALLATGVYFPGLAEDHKNYREVCISQSEWSSWFRQISEARVLPYDLSTLADPDEVETRPVEER